MNYKPENSFEMWIPGISRRQTWLLWGLLLYVPPFSTYNIRYVFNIQHSISGTYPIFNIQYQVLEVFGPPCPNFQFDFWIVKKCHLLSFLQKSWDFLDRQFWDCLLKCVKWFGKWGRKQMEQKGGKRGLARSTDPHYLLLSDTDHLPQWQTMTDNDHRMES